MIHRSTCFKDAKLCPCLYYYRYELGLQKVGEGKPSPHLEFGRLLHDALEILTDEGLEAALSHIEKTPIPPDRVKTPEVAAALLRIYHSRNQVKVIVPEREFSFQGPNFIWQGRDDGIGSFNGTMYVVEHKTTDPWYLLLFPNDQFIAYYIGAKVTFPDVQGIIINNLDPKKIELHQHIINYSDEAVENWLTETKKFTDYLLSCQESNTWPRNEQACRAYGRLCEFHLLCSEQSNTTRTMIMSKCYQENKKLKDKAW